MEENVWNVYFVAKLRGDSFRTIWLFQERWVLFVSHLLRCLNNAKVRPFPPPKSMKLRKGQGFLSSLHEKVEGVFTKFDIFNRRLSMIDNTWWVSLKENKTFGLHHDKSLYVNIIPMRSWDILQGLRMCGSVYAFVGGHPRTFLYF